MAICGGHSIYAEAFITILLTVIENSRGLRRRPVRGGLDVDGLCHFIAVGIRGLFICRGVTIIDAQNVGTGI